MQNTSFLQHLVKPHLLSITYAVALSTASYLVWGTSLERESAPLGVGLRLAALTLVVAWSHFLVWIFRKISRQEISVAHCATLFFGAWAVFFLIYNCLI